VIELFYIFTRAQVQCRARWAKEQVCYIRNVNMKQLQMRCKCQNVLIYKSCLMVKVFWDH